MSRDPSERAQNTEFKGPGRGGGSTRGNFVKLNFEIAVDQQTRTCDQTFGGGGSIPRPKMSHNVLKNQQSIRV